MPVAIDPEERVEYILEAEREKEKHTTFFLLPPTSSKKNRIKGRFINLLQQHGVGVNEIQDNELPFEVAIEYSLIVLEEVLVGWDNFLDAQKRRVPFKSVNLRANIDRLTPEDQEELAAEAQRLSGLTEEESKN